MPHDHRVPLRAQLRRDTVRARGLLFAMWVGCTIALSSAPTWAFPFVNNLSDFETHIIAHKTRVIEGALYLKNTLHPEIFGSLPDALVVSYLQLHDANKLVTAGADPLRIQKALFANWGLNFAAASNEAKQRSLATVNELNQLDAVLAKNFFDNNVRPKFANWGQVEHQLQQLEKIADQVDRWADPVASEEFGRVLSPASEFMKVPEDKALARDLEKTYKAEILEKHSYQLFRARSPCVNAFSLAR